MNNIEFKMSSKELSDISGDVLEYLENKELKLTEIIVVLDSALGIMRAKLTNTVGFAALAQTMKEIISGNI